MPERLLVLVILIAVVGVPAGIRWAKGQRAAFFLGFLLLGTVWIVAACRLAQPASWWARRFYGPEKVQRAMDRFDVDQDPINGFDIGGETYDPGDGESSKRLRRRARRVAHEHRFNPYHYKCSGRFGCVPVQKSGPLIDFSGVVDDVVKWYSNWQFENETADRNAVRAAIKEYVGSYTQHKSLWVVQCQCLKGISV